MKVRRNSGFNFEVTTNDLKLIRRAISSWKPRFNNLKFDGGALFNSIEGWKQFIDTDWETWDVAEYNHDLGCRYWIQIAIENATEETSQLLSKYLYPIDRLFILKMKPISKEFNNQKINDVFKQETYFWYTHSIHPDHIEH